MDHIAILKNSCIKRGDDLLEDIIAGDKTIESRWYINRIAPWNKIKKGDMVYLKESGASIKAKAKVSKVLQYDNLNEYIIKEIAEKYGKKISPHTSKKEFIESITKQKKKRYCILIFLEKVKKIKSFDIDKTGYGISSAWLVTDSIDKLKK